jgi:hypothetical protein
MYHLPKRNGGKGGRHKDKIVEVTYQWRKGRASRGTGVQRSNAKSIFRQRTVLYNIFFL